MDVAGWLRTLGFETLIDAFDRERIDAPTLFHLDGDDLKELGVTALGDRKRLLAAIAALRAGDVEDRPSDDGADEAGERREVTIVFADLCGFTALSRRLGAEATHAILRRLFARLDAVIADHGGTVDKHIGDAVMAAFGAPRAHGDDPERAVAAALAMVDAAREVGAEIGESLALHVGVASGSVVSARTTAAPTARPELTGDAVNLAARLTDHAPPGQVLVCAATRSACARRIETESAGLRALKGFAEPMPAWRATALRPAAVADIEDDAPLVGRTAELARFAEACARVQAQGDAAFILLRGEAGIGKSRLARAIARSLLGLATGRETARNAALPGEATIGIAEEVVLRDFAGLSLDAPRRAILGAMDTAARREALRSVLAHLLRAASHRAPLLVVLEDLHWAEPPAVDALQDLVQRAADAAIVFVVTTRAVDRNDGSWTGAAAAIAPTLLDLEPLQPAEARAFAEAQAALSPERLDHCLARAEGHPLFLEQLLRHVQDDGLSALPGSLRSIVLARMDALDAKDRAALQAAAILGNVADTEALRFLLARPSFRPDALVEAGLLRTTPDGLAFRHALIRDGALAAMLGARRRALHARAASWFESRDPSRRAEHLEGAGDARAAAAFAAAARIARADHRLEEAPRLARRGMALASARPDTHALARLLGDTLRDLGDAQGSLTSCLAAVESADEPGARAAALLSAAETMRIMDRLDDALGCVAAAEGLAAGEGRSDLLAQAAHLRGNLHFPRGESELCRAAHARASELAEASGAPELVALSQGGLGDAAYALGRLRTAAGHFARCVEIARAHGLMRIEAANAPMLAFARILQTSPADEVADAQRSIDLARDVAHLRAGVVAHHAVVLPSTWRLDLDRAEAHVGEARALARRAGAWRFEAENLAFLADIRRLQGRGDEALELLAEAVAIARRTGLRYFGPIILGNLALAARDATQRRDALAEGEALLTDGALAHNRLFFHDRAIEIAIADRDVAGLRRHADALARAFAEEPIMVSDFLVARARALADAIEMPRNASVRGALTRLHATAHAGAWRAYLPAIERALDHAGDAR